MSKKPHVTLKPVAIIKLKFMGNCGWCGCRITHIDKRGDAYKCPDCEHEHEINDQGNLIPSPDYSWIANGNDDDEGDFEGDPFEDDPDDYEDSWQFGTVI